MKKEEVIEELEKVLTEGNSENSFNSNFYAFTSKLATTEREPIYRHFLLKNNHFEHEEIVSAFQHTFHNSKSNCDLLLQAIVNIPNYLSSDDLKYSYIRKCIYSIGAQPNPTNIDTLETLTKFTDNTIKELAIQQMSKRKEQGRWEFNKKN